MDLVPVSGAFSQRIVCHKTLLGVAASCLQRKGHLGSLSSFIKESLAEPPQLRQLSTVKHDAASTVDNPGYKLP